VILSSVEPSRKTQFYALASIAIVLGLLYFGQEVLIPLALAVLFSFLLAPVVSWLERLRLGRVPSTLIVVFAALALVVGFGWIVEQRFAEIVTKLPDYRQSIQSKFQHLTRSGGMVETVRKELHQSVQDSLTTQASAATQACPTTQSSIAVASGVSGTAPQGGVACTISPETHHFPRRRSQDHCRAVDEQQTRRGGSERCTNRDLAGCTPQTIRPDHPHDPVGKSGRPANDRDEVFSAA
jgi:hypothetical protein